MDSGKESQEYKCADVRMGKGANTCSAGRQRNAHASGCKPRGRQSSTIH